MEDKVEDQIWEKSYVWPRQGEAAESCNGVKDG